MWGSIGKTFAIDHDAHAKRCRVIAKRVGRNVRLTLLHPTTFDLQIALNQVEPSAYLPDRAPPACTTSTRQSP